jgi:hypothetical protein
VLSSLGSIYQDACRFFLYESGFALFIALLINIAVVSVSGTVCFRDNLSADDADKCSELSLDNSSFLLKVLISPNIYHVDAMIATCSRDYTLIKS